METNHFRSDRAPLTNWVGHQVSRAFSAGFAGIEKLKNPDIDYKHAYNLRLMQEQRLDFRRGNCLSAIALLAATLAVNSIR